MPRRYHVLLAVVLSSTLCVLAQAAPDKIPEKATKRPQKGHMSPIQLFKASDANKDGKVSLEELRAKRPQFPEQRFQRMDKNKDGFLEEDELPAPGRGPGGNIFARIDANKDDKISFSEFKKHAPKMDEKRFASLDKNGDGFVERKELPQRAPRHAERPHKAQKRPDGGVYLARLIEKNDTDGNKELTLAELLTAKPGFPASTFTALDRDNNGVLNSKDIEIRSAARGSGLHPQKRGGSKGKKGHQGRMREGDTNKDGKLSFEEAQAVFPKITRERFDHRDRNGDGFLSPQDRKAP